MAVTMITVTGTYLLETGAAASGQIDFALSSVLQDATAKKMYAPVAVSGVLVAGVCTVVLIATNDPTSNPAGLTYQVTERITNAPIRTYSINVPYTAAGATIDLATLAPVVAPVLSTNYVLLTSVGAANGVASLDGTGKVPAAQIAGGGGSAIAISTIAFAATITPAVSASINVFEVGALTANIIVANPTGAATDGMTMVFRFVQNATGGWTTTWGAAYVFGTDVAANLIPTIASSQYELTFRYHALTSVWRCVGIVRGFTS